MHRPLFPPSSTSVTWRMASSSSSSSSQSETEDNVPLSKLKRPPRKKFDESSDEEDNIPLSELHKTPTKSHLQSESIHDDDIENKEEGGKEMMLLTRKSHGVGWLRMMSSPPVSIWFGMVARLSNALILQVEPGFGGVITARTNGVVGITPRL